MMGERISVIIPVYNVENYIEMCLESVIHQTYTNLQIILIDDGSSDRSGMICDRYQEKDPRIQVIHQINSGVSNARNKGLTLVKGSYVTFCDADDWIEPDMYEYLYGLLQQSECNIASCGARKESTESKVVVRSSKDKVLHMNKKEAIAAFHLRKDMNEWIVTKLFEKSVISGLLFDESLRVCEDYVFGCDAIEKSIGVVCGTEIKYHYIQRKSSVSNHGYTEEFEKGLTAMEKYIDKYMKQYPDKKKDILAKYMLENMGILTAMIKGNCIDRQRVRNVRKYIKDNLWTYVFTKGVSLYLKGSAIVICLNFELFAYIYRHLKRFN
ncbi:MAG: glycosyltransferase [Lachnospiraceae bacterium]|nr:glycosyltransferase [Lachnospiraceae bacterium]